MRERSPIHRYGWKAKRYNMENFLDKKVKKKYMSIGHVWRINQRSVTIVVLRG